MEVELTVEQLETAQRNEELSLLEVGIEGLDNECKGLTHDFFPQGYNAMTPEQKRKAATQAIFEREVQRHTSSMGSGTEGRKSL